MDPFFTLVHLGAKLISHLSSLQACKYEACLNELYTLFHLKAKLILVTVFDAYNFHVYRSITQCDRASLSCLIPWFMVLWEIHRCTFTLRIGNYGNVRQKMSSSWSN